MSKVYIVSGLNRKVNVFEALQEIKDEVKEKIESADLILIKPNLVHHINQLASTHVDAVRATIEFIRLSTMAHIVVGDSGYHGTKEAFRNFGYLDLEKEYQRVELRDLNDDETVGGHYSIRADGSKNPVMVSKTAVDADVKISLTQMKTHRDTGVSLTIKNWAVGTWVPPARNSETGTVWARWPWMHEEGPWAHHKSIAELYRQMKPDIAIIDALEAMEGNGPTDGDLVATQLAIAGADAVAVDVVGCALMGIDPHDIGYLVMAAGSEKDLDIMNLDAPALMIGEHAREFKKPDSWDELVVGWKQGEGQITNDK